MDNNLKITSIEELKHYAEGEIIELPPFSESQPFVVRMKRPSMLALVKAGKIPNSLLGSANQLFASDTEAMFDESNDRALSETFDIIDIMCEAAFLEPTFEQIKSAGIELTDDQYMFVFNYCQNGVRALQGFRQ